MRVRIGKKEEEDAEHHRLAEHMRKQSFVHSDILKDKLDELTKTKSELAKTMDAAQRSKRENGHSGLAAIQGHASPVALVQSITGGTRADAPSWQV